MSRGIKYPLPFPMHGFTYGEPIKNVWDFYNMFRFKRGKERYLEVPIFFFSVKLHTTEKPPSPGFSLYARWYAVTN